MGRIIAIDYGVKRTGIAWTDPLQLIATGVGSIDTGLIWKELERIMRTEMVELFLVGMPMRMNGTDTHTSEAVRMFCAELGQKFPDITIQLYDERFTSKMASRAIAVSGLKKSKREDKHLVNTLAATIMLQEYLQFK